MTLREVNRVGEGKKNVPKLRFKGYEDDWEQRKLSDVVNSVDTGKSKFQKEGSSGKYAILGSTSVIGYDDEYDYEGDFLLTARVGANAGSIYRHAGKVKISDNTVFIQASENIEFLYHLLTHFDIKKLSFGTGQPLVKASELKNLELVMPIDVAEQKNIRAFFRNLDKLITLHQRKYDALKTMKKTLLSKMFPKDGEDVPEIRFKGFTDAWEQRKAKRLFVSWVDKGYPDLPVLSATQDKGMVRRDENGINIHYDEKNKSGYKRVMPGQFVIHLRSFQGGFAYSEVEGITSPAYTVFDFKEFDKHIPEFWKYVFSSKDFIRRLEKVTYGIRDGRSIGFEDFLTLKFNVPEKREQKVIAEILAGVNNLITLHQRKLDELKNMKKTLLQQMFV